MKYEFTLLGRFRIAERLMKDFSHEMKEFLDKKILYILFWIIFGFIIYLLMLLIPDTSVFMFIIGIVLFSVVALSSTKLGSRWYRTIVCVFYTKQCIDYLENSRKLHEDCFYLESIVVAYETIAKKGYSNSSSLKSVIIQFSRDLKLCELQLSSNVLKKLGQIHSFKTPAVQHYFHTTFKDIMKKNLPLMESYIAQEKKKRLFLASLSQDLAVKQEKNKIKVIPRQEWVD